MTSWSLRTAGCSIAHRWTGVCRTADGSVDVEIDQLMTRGLAVGEDEIAVGSSLFDMKPHRLLTPGFVTFLGRDYRRLSRVHVPAAPTQIRRLDGVDLSLSQPRLAAPRTTAERPPVTAARAPQA